MDGGKLTGGKFTIDIAGLKVTDGAGAKLESNLKSADFLKLKKIQKQLLKFLV
jgi:hypothetical protein